MGQKIGELLAQVQRSVHLIKSRLSSILELPNQHPMKGQYSALRILREGLRGQKGWGPAWRSPTPKQRYDVIVIGAGGHGLATAYYLASKHGVTNVAVLEKGWLGGGNTGRNTTTIRSNYYYPESSALYEFSVQLYEGLSKELNYNVMFSQRGVMTLAHSQPQMEMAVRQVNAMQINGTDAEVLDTEGVRALAPIFDYSPQARFPVEGAIFQRRAGTARHDAVAWGYARAADRLGVDIIQNCEVTDLIVNNGRVAGVKTTQGDIASDIVGAAPAGHSSVLASMAGTKLPLTSYVLQAMVSEPLKPVMNTVALSPGFGTYFCQTDKGGILVGGVLDRVPSYVSI
jgi:sarcosine oxidase subunit beta